MIYNQSPLVKKFQSVFDEMNLKEKVTVTLEIHEVSMIIATLVAADAQTNMLEMLLTKQFDKAKLEFEESI